MAKKNKEKIILEDIELKPQVIGYTYKKKSNIGRVIFIFIVFALAVFYINDISVFINDLLGKSTSSSIQNNAGSNNKNENNSNNVENQLVYNIFSNTLEVSEGNIILKNFNLSNNLLSLDVFNNSNSNIDLTNKNYYIELYNENKTLLERHKIDLEIIQSNSSKSYTFSITNTFYYFVLEEKTIDDYPVVNLVKDTNGVAQLTCKNNYENIVYTFKNDELTSINHTISENDTNADGYYIRYNNFQTKVTKLNLFDGFTATFNGSLNGYTTIIAIDLQNADLNSANEKYYYSYKEMPKVVNFEMQTYGFTCN